MHPLHDYVAAQLADKLKARHVVVWYDERSEFAPFIAELRGAPGLFDAPSPVMVAGVEAQLAEYAGSFFGLRALVEPLVAGSKPGLLVVLVPGLARDRRDSVLMELETAGECWEPQLKRLARNLLRKRYTDGAIDDLFAAEGVGYDDLARAASMPAGGESPSILKVIFHDASTSEALIAGWLASESRDAEIESKGGKEELSKLLRSRLGLEVALDAPLAKTRAIALRYVLVGEFRGDLRCDPPDALAGIPVPPTKDEAKAVKDVARLLRAAHASEYSGLADGVEVRLGLAMIGLPGEVLGTIDTFRFEERALLRHCGDLVATGKHGVALAVIAEREHNFWLDRDVARKAQWEACRRMAELGAVAAQVRKAVAKAGGDVGSWVESYRESWYRLDQAQRRFETWLTNLEEEPEERPLGVVRREYDQACGAMAEGFARVLEKAQWSAPGILHQTRVYADVLAARPKPVAYFMVDALRYEMGVELAERLPKTAEVSIRPAVAAFPSITPVGMGALLPGAAASFSVVAQGGRLGSRIEDSFLPDLAARKKLFMSRAPGLLDIGLDELLTLTKSKLAKKVQDASLVVVRSQEIDHAGEAGFSYQARQVMDNVIDNLGRAIRKLAAARVENAVVTADHGHLFYPADRDESMRIDSPGGQQVELHRRCWIGRGGATPMGCKRVPASALGYDSDLDFVFPAGLGVFKAGGDLAFHHGGATLQELIVPVVTIRLKAVPLETSKQGPMEVSGLPATITNRIFTVTLQLSQQSLFDAPVHVRPLLMVAGQQVGAVGMVVDAQFDRATGSVRLEPGKAATVALFLSAEGIPAVRLVVQDPATDAELYRSPADIPVRLGVA